MPVKNTASEVKKERESLEKRKQDLTAKLKKIEKQLVQLSFLQELETGKWYFDGDAMLFKVKENVPATKDHDPLVEVVCFFFDADFGEWGPVTNEFEESDVCIEEVSPVDEALAKEIVQSYLTCAIAKSKITGQTPYYIDQAKELLPEFFPNE